VKSSIFNSYLFLVTFFNYQVQKQLQLRIEAQGRYLQMIIEEQQRLGSALHASSEDNQKPSEPTVNAPISDDYLDPSLPALKKPRLDGKTPDLPAHETTQSNLKSVFFGTWDHEFHERNVAGFGFEGIEFKRDVNGTNVGSSKVLSDSIGYGG
jgi:MYB-CC type transfactor, LHEQLE motif